MKIRNPKNRFDLTVRPKDLVLEVGGGHNPHPRSNIVMDKFVDDNTHRSGDIKVLKHQKFLSGDGENLPFKDKEFDYVICCHVLEHVGNPARFLSEQFRVAKRGYIEFPSLLGEWLCPKESHTWIMHEFKDTLYLVDKKKIGFACNYDLVELVQDYLPTHSIGFKILERTHPNMMTIRIEWENNFNYVVEPADPEILKFFSGKWRSAWADSFFPPRSMAGEFKDTLRALADISKKVIRSKVLKR
jgi:SAM-dependent methyltransferase